MLTGYLFRGGLNRPPPVADMSFQRLWQLGLTILKVDKENWVALGVCMAVWEV